MSALVYPVPHTTFEPDCYGCWYSRSACKDVCNACGCRWDIDLTDEPNVQEEACEGGCDCHTWTLVGSRRLAAVGDGLEAAWREAGYADSMAAWQAEGR